MPPPPDSPTSPSIVSQIPSSLPRLTPKPSPNSPPPESPLQEIQPPSTSSPKPIPETGTFNGAWVGTTEQGSTISFQVVPSSNGESVVNFSTSFNFEASCPIGRVTFSSLDDAHIWEPANSFRFNGLTERNAFASVEAAFKSNRIASGKLQVVDNREPRESLDSPCSFINVISWSARRQ